MRGLTAFPAAIFSCVTCVAVLFLAGGCSSGEERARRVSIEEMLISGQSLDGVRLRIEGCIESNPHGVMINTCHSGERGIPVLFSKSAGRYAPILYERGILLEGGQEKEVVAALCGDYSQNPDGKDRWFEVDSFFMDDRAYGDGFDCAADRERWR